LGQAFELIEEGIRFSLPTVFNSDIRGREMAAVLGELKVKYSLSRCTISDSLDWQTERRVTGLILTN